MKLSVSFKNNEVEQQIYNHIISKLNYSVYIKELILADMRRNGQPEPTPKVESKPINSNDSMQIEW